MPSSSLFVLSLLGVLGAVAPSVSAQSAPPDLSDAEVAHVAVTANSIDIELARLAESRARRQDVKDFAATMIRDHSAVNAAAGALAAKLKVTPKDNGVSQSLRTGAEQATATLGKLSGPDFDRGYVDREVGYHQAVLEALDGVLIPTTDNAELRKLLVEVRPAIAAHLAHARQIQAALEAAR